MGCAAAVCGWRAVPAIARVAALVAAFCFHSQHCFYFFFDLFIFIILYYFVTTFERALMVFLFVHAVVFVLFHSLDCLL